MSGITLKTILFYIVAVIALTNAAPAPSMLREGAVEESGSGILAATEAATTEFEPNDVTTTASAGTTLQCSTNGDSAYNVSSLFHGQVAIFRYLEVGVHTILCTLSHAH